MPKISITKSAVRDFVRSEYLKRYEPLKNARTEALRNAIEASPLFVKFKDLLSSAESVANALEKAGYGSTFRQRLGSCDEMLNRTISNLWTASIDGPKDEIKSLYTIAKPYDEKLEKLENAYQSARRVIDAAPGGKAAADILKLSGIDYYEWQNTDRGATLDLSALKGGD